MAAATAVIVGATALTTQQSIRQQNIAERNRDKARAVEEKRQRYLAQKERRAQINAAIRARADINNQSTIAGIAQSSGAITGQGAVQTAAASNIGNINAMQDYSEQISLFNSKASDATTRAANAQAIGSAVVGTASLFAPRPGTKT